MKKNSDIVSDKLAMPRKPRRRGELHPPIGFSSFARSVQLLNGRASNTKLLNGSSSKYSEDEIPKHSLKGKNKQVVESESYSESKSSDEELSQEEVQADFAFFDPKPDDFHGVKILLQRYLDDKQWDLSDFVELILAQTTVGSVVKLEDDEDNGSFAIVTALNLGRYKDHKCMNQVKDYLLKACDDKLVGQLKALVEERAMNVGLLVSQRVMNLPPQLLPHLYDGLFDEISWAVEDEPTEELRKSFCFEHYILLTKIYKKKAQNKKKVNSNEEDVIYLKPEDELFHKLCSWSYMFPLQNQQLGDQELKNYQLTGLVMAVEAGFGLSVSLLVKIAIFTASGAIGLVLEIWSIMHLSCICST